MKLTLEQIKQIANGSVEMELLKNGLIRLYRLTAAQRQVYREMSEFSYNRACNSSGIQLVMQTDSHTLTLDVAIAFCTTREFFSIDVYADDAPVGYIKGYGHDTMFGDHRKTFALGPGSKTVRIYLPWSVMCDIRAVELADGSHFSPVKREKTLLAFGDSITQGFDTLRPSLCYIARIADWLGATLYNKAIGGSQFSPAMLEKPEQINPDYITVAYGTNDWRHGDLDTFRRDSRLFLHRLREQYPNAKLFVLAPIWRKDLYEDVPFMPFASVYPELCDAAADIPNTVVIDCFSFVPEDEAFYQDKRLHPNDAGFAHYFENLCHAMTPYV